MKKFALVLIIVITLLFPSCAERGLVPCREVLLEMTGAEVGLPSGKIYSLSAPRGDGEYLSEHLINSLYGDGSTPVMSDGWLDLALFLPSSAHPCEMAVFLCNSRDTANDTARMLCRRLGSLRQAKGNGELSYYFESASVTVRGNYVLLVISSDTENILKVASKAIG